MTTAQRVRDHFQPFFEGERTVTDLRSDDFRRYRLHLESKGLAPLTVRHLLSDARCFCNWCVESGELDRSPFPRRIMPRIQEVPPDRLTDGEVAAVLAIGEPQAFVVRLGLASALRWGELCRVEARDVDARGMLRIAQTKSGRIRRVPLPPPLLSEIDLREGRLAPYAEGSPGSFTRMVRHRSGVKAFHVHQLRHTFACRWLERGGSLVALQQILGHASVTTTQRYARLSDDHVHREAERIMGVTTR